MSSLTIYLDTAKAPRQDFEDEYECPGRDEKENLAMPREYVVVLLVLKTKEKYPE